MGNKYDSTILRARSDIAILLHLSPKDFGEWYHTRQSILNKQLQEPYFVADKLSMETVTSIPSLDDVPSSAQDYFIAGILWFRDGFLKSKEYLDVIRGLYEETNNVKIEG